MPRIPILKSFIIASRHFHGAWIVTIKATCKRWIFVFLKSTNYERGTKTVVRIKRPSGITILCNLSTRSFHSNRKQQLEMCSIVVTDTGFIDLLVFCRLTFIHPLSPLFHGVSWNNCLYCRFYHLGKKMLLLYQKALKKVTVLIKRLFLARAAMKRKFN